MPRQLLWFMLVGALSTVLQTIVYVSVREVLAATWASWLALLVVTPANTEAHRRITFNVTTSAIGRLHWEAGLTSVVVYLANLAVAPWLSGIAGPHPSALTESLILALTGSVVGGARYLILRGWVFAARRHTPAPESATAATATAGEVPGGTIRSRRSRRTALRRFVRTSATGARPLPRTPGAPTAAGTPDFTTAVPGDALRTACGTPGGLPLAVLACLGTLAPIPTARLCSSHSGPGVLNQRPAGRIRTWHRNRRQHLTARS
ncbi:GtrA-like protein [Actinoplanes teichomyceticus]|uniref:GtrA-like protein n=1 Tax=Actinoplanes teichomyceticus TaxID=1867 RepID=A0A561WJP5_ACTTI|nr:GtrA-like protein [Actinoplanes teichomyceticus]GIF12135.1 hypothetical protein Ate01nite_21670 [Actinoplanes teichomyceticus]